MRDITSNDYWPCACVKRDRKGGDPDEWPEYLRCREFPKAVRA